MTRTTTLKLVTIIAEPVLEDRLLRDLHRFGASGHTRTEVHGEGSRGMRAGEVPGLNIKLETIVSPAVADRILDALHDHYFPQYAVIAYVGDVQVVRGDKYTGAERGR